MFSNSLVLKSQWIKGASGKLPRPREKAAGGMTEDGNLILAGGLNSAGEPTRTVWMYDADKKTWITTLPPLKQERYSHGCTIKDDKIYMFGGRDKKGVALKSVEMMNLKRKSRGWSFLPPMKQARVPLAVSTVGSNVYVFGSESSDSETYNRNIHGSVESFNLKDRRWNLDRMPPIPNENRALVGSSVVLGNIYLISTDKKTTKMGNSKYKTMVFNPSSSRWLNTKQLPSVTKLKRRGKAVLGSAMVFTFGYDDEKFEEDELSIDWNNDKEAGKEAAQEINKATAKTMAKSTMKGTGAGTGVNSGIVTTISSKVIVTTVAVATVASASVGGLVAATIGISKTDFSNTTAPTGMPTAVTTVASPGTSTPTRPPTSPPTSFITSQPTIQPQLDFLPTTPRPTLQPQLDDRDFDFDDFQLDLTFPALSPTISPSVTPSKSASLEPSIEFSKDPTNTPTKFPTSSPIVSPSSTPTTHSSSFPTIVSSLSPTIHASQVPSSTATSLPSVLLSLAPTEAASSNPTISASSPPTLTPSYAPSTSPTAMPTWSPSITPSTSPPSYIPSVAPSVLPSFPPSNFPTVECNGRCDPTNQVCSEGLCECIEGYFSPSGKGGTCQCENECTYSDMNDCHRKADCIEECPGYRCKCQTGYEGDGTQCDDIDECVTDPDICGEDICINRPGTYECVAPTPAPTPKPTPTPETLGPVCPCVECCSKGQ